jgi:hypothetical protein
MSDEKLLDRCVVMAIVVSVLAVTSGWLVLEFVGTRGGQLVCQPPSDTNVVSTFSVRMAGRERVFGG